MEKSLRIVHCANFSDLKNAEVFYSMDRKISHGLVENGHFIYDFSYRDLAKSRRFLGFKKKSIDEMNKSLIKVCKNLKPDLLLLSKAEMIYPETLNEIKKIFPQIKIAKWFVDIVETQDSNFFKQFEYIDYFFQTAGSRLNKLSIDFKDMTCAYLPSISDKAFDRRIDIKKEYDIIYIARDHKEDVRYKFAQELNKFCNENKLKLKLFGSLGNPPIFGQNYYYEIAKAKIAINFNRDEYLDKKNENKIMESSDRMNHFLGTGTCTFNPEINEMDRLFENEKDIIYFVGIDDCFKKIKNYLKDDKYLTVGEKGSAKAFEIVNAKRVTGYMIELILNNKSSYEYEWSDYIFNNGKSLKGSI